MSNNPLLSGTVSPERGQLSAVTSLSVVLSSITLLSGSIPPRLGGLSALQHLDFYNTGQKKSLKSGFHVEFT